MVVKLDITFFAKISSVISQPFLNDSPRLTDDFIHSLSETISMMMSKMLSSRDLVTGVRGYDGVAALPLSWSCFGMVRINTLVKLSTFFSLLVFELFSDCKILTLSFTCICLRISGSKFRELLWGSVQRFMCKRIIIEKG